MGRLLYLLAHGCKEGLVAKPADWPGPHCADALVSGRPSEGVWFVRRKEWIARKGGEAHPADAFASAHQLTLAPLPCWRHLPPPVIRPQVAAILGDIEREVAARQRTEGRSPLGVAAILRQDPHHRPPKTSRSPAILAHAASKKVRLELRAAYNAFNVAFRQAAERLKAGCRDVLFPDGCFPPPLPFCSSA